MKLFLNYIELALIFVKSLTYWIYQSLISLVPWGLKRKNWKTINQYFSMAQKISKFAKKERIARDIGWLAKKFDDLTKQYSDQDTKRAATEITNSDGILNDLKIGYEIGGVITANIGPIETKYDPRNGQFKWGMKL